MERIQLVTSMDLSLRLFQAGVLIPSMYSWVHNPNAASNKYELMEVEEGGRTNLLRSKYDVVYAYTPQELLLMLPENMSIKLSVTNSKKENVTFSSEANGKIAIRTALADSLGALVLAYVVQKGSSETKQQSPIVF